MPDDIFEAISLWIALHKPKSEFPSRLTPELEEFWIKVKKDTKDIEGKEFSLEIPII